MTNYKQVYVLEDGEYIKTPSGFEKLKDTGTEPKEEKRSIKKKEKEKEKKTK